jgi:hypothetical protein
MAKRSSRRDVLDVLSNFFAHHKGVPVLVGVGIVFVGMILAFFPALSENGGLWGWLVQSHALLYLGVIVGLLGVLLGDAL